MQNRFPGGNSKDDMWGMFLFGGSPNIMERWSDRMEHWEDRMGQWADRWQGNRPQNPSNSSNYPTDQNTPNAPRNSHDPWWTSH